MMCGSVGEVRGNEGGKIGKIGKWKYKKLGEGKWGK